MRERAGPRPRGRAPAAACTAEAILEAARRALVAAKAAGRNRTVDARA